MAIKIYGSNANESHMRVNETMCLLADSKDRFYDNKGKCYIPLTEDNIKNFCAISVPVKKGWCDQSIMTELLTNRSLEK